MRSPFLRSLVKPISGFATRTGITVSKRNGHTARAVVSCKMDAFSPNSDPDVGGITIPTTSSCTACVERQRRQNGPDGKERFQEPATFIWR